MTKFELIKILEEIPGNPTIYYQDMNFGGKEDKVEVDWLKFIDDDYIIVSSMLWKPCN